MTTELSFIISAIFMALWQSLVFLAKYARIVLLNIYSLLDLLFATLLNAFIDDGGNIAYRFSSPLAFATIVLTILLFFRHWFHSYKCAQVAHVLERGKWLTIGKFNSLYENYRKYYLKYNEPIGGIALFKNKTTRTTISSPHHNDVFSYIHNCIDADACPLIRDAIGNGERILIKIEQSDHAIHSHNIWL